MSTAKESTNGLGTCRLASNRVDERLGVVGSASKWYNKQRKPTAAAACIGNGELKMKVPGCIESRRPSPTPVDLKLAGDLSNRIDKRLGVVGSAWKK